MIVYWSMIVWISAWGILSSLYNKKNNINNRIESEKITFMWAFIIFSVIIFFVGLRSGIADTSTYIDIFKSYPTEYNDIKANFFNENDRDLGFKLISMLIKVFISKDFHVWLFIIATISGLATMIPLQKYSCDFKVSILIFILSCKFTWLLNGMRQYLAASIIFMCTPLILKKKTNIYILIILLLSTIHKTALIMIPAYFIVKEKAFSKKTYIFTIIILIIILLGDKFTEILNIFIEDTSYGEAINNLSITDDGPNFLRIIAESVPTIIAFMYRDKIKEIATPIIHLSINMSLITTGLYIVSKVARSGIMLGRLPIYFSLYNLILLPWLIHNLFNKKEKRLVMYIMLVSYFIYFYVEMYMAWGGLGYISDVLKIDIR